VALTVRSLRADDVAPLDRVLQVAYARPSPWIDRLRFYLEAPQVASFVADDAGTPVGCVFAIDYGSVGYVSMMGVDPSAQGRGVGRALFSALLAWGEGRRLPWRLDATPMGAPLYASCGFVDDGETIALEAAAPVAHDPQPTVRHATLDDLDAIAALDRHAFGADRRWRLAVLFAEPGVTVLLGPGNAFAGVRANGLIGPIVAPDAKAAAAVIDAALAMQPGTPRRVHAPAANRAVVELLERRGFRGPRRLRHMRRGPAPAGDANALWGRISLGEG
jgi:GNAT superfamily N-acetyltransferase